MRGSRKKQQKLQQHARMNRKQVDDNRHQTPAATAPNSPANHVVLIEPRDPLVFRDARPFSAEPGARAFCLPFPMPRSVAGALRTHIGNTAHETIDWQSHENTNRISQIVVHGPLLLGKGTGDPDDPAWHVHIPAPRDVVFYKNGDKNLDGMILRPVRIDPDGNSGCNLPKKTATAATNGYERALENTALRPMKIKEDIKPESDVPHWWRLDDTIHWLTTPTGTKQDLPIVQASNKSVAIRGMPKLANDTRVHVGIDKDTLTHHEGALFTTESLAFPEGSTQPKTPNAQVKPPAAMLCRIETDITWRRDDAHLPLGGERRLARIRFDDPAISWPAVTVPTNEAFALANGLRLLLVTPALFAHGWLPAWMSDATIPGLGELKTPVQLVGATIERRIPVSGWGITRKGGTNQKELGARATRYAVPAGGVYFFRFRNGAPDLATWKTIWERLWLAPVSDRQIDCNSGFGLVLPGLWRDENANETAGSEE